LYLYHIIDDWCTIAYIITCITLCQLYRINSPIPQNTLYKTRIPIFQNNKPMGKIVISTQPNTLPIKTPGSFRPPWNWSLKQNQILTRSSPIFSQFSEFDNSITPLQDLRFVLRVSLFFCVNFDPAFVQFGFQFQLLGFWFFNWYWFLALLG